MKSGSNELRCRRSRRPTTDTTTNIQPRSPANCRTRVPHLTSTATPLTQPPATTMRTRDSSTTATPGSLSSPFIRPKNAPPIGTLRQPPRHRRQRSHRRRRRRIDAIYGDCPRTAHQYRIPTIRAKNNITPTVVSREGTATINHINERLPLVDDDCVANRDFNEATFADYSIAQCRLQWQCDYHRYLRVLCVFRFSVLLESVSAVIDDCMTETDKKNSFMPPRIFLTFDTWAWTKRPKHASQMSRNPIEVAHKTVSMPTQTIIRERQNFPKRCRSTPFRGRPAVDHMKEAGEQLFSQLLKLTPQFSVWTMTPSWLKPKMVVWAGWCPHFIPACRYYIRMFRRWPTHTSS